LIVIESPNAAKPAMRPSDIGPLPLTLMASLLVAVILLAVRVFVLQRVQRRWQRENRQQSERLKPLIAAYRSLGGSFSPATKEQVSQIEETLAEIVLFGSLPQVEMAASCIARLKRCEPVDYQPLIEALRSDLRTQLGLEPIPESIALPPSGPGRPGKGGKGDGDGGGGGGNGGGGGGNTAAGAGGLGVGMLASEQGPAVD
jgi:hypothetical protein